MAMDMNMFVRIDNSKSSCVDRCEHESKEFSLRTPGFYTTYKKLYIDIHISIAQKDICTYRHITTILACTC